MTRKKTPCALVILMVLIGCEKGGDSDGPSRVLAPWPPVRSDVSPEDRPSFQMDAPRLVVTRWFSFWCRLKSDGFHDATKAERHWEKQWREGMGVAGLPVIRMYHVWGHRAAVLAFLDAACAALAGCPEQKLVAILDSPDSGPEDPLLTAARQAPLASDDGGLSGQPEMLYLRIGLAMNTGIPGLLAMSARVGSLNRADGKYRVTVPGKHIAPLVRAACASGADRFSELSVTSFGEGGARVRKGPRGGVRKKTKRKRGAAASRDASPAGTVILEFPSLPGALSQAGRWKALWTPAGEVLGEGFDNIARMDPKNASWSWTASPDFVAYGLGVVGKLDSVELDSGGTGFRFTVVDAVVTRGPEANEGRE